MSRSVKLLDIFLSSPSDLDPERELVIATAAEWNALRSKNTGYFLNVLTWEDVVAPKLSDRAQAVINDQIGDDYDVYLGMMWGRFGAPTGAADSGTVEEFERALLRYRDGNTVRLAMLFKTNDIPQSQLDGAQFDKVKEFKTRFSSEGGFYGEFESDDRLRRCLNALFEDVVNTRSDRPVNQNEKLAETQENSKIETTIGVAPDSTQQSQFDDLGLFEVNEILIEITEEQSNFFNQLTEETDALNTKLTTATAEMESLTKYGEVDTHKIKPVVTNISNAMSTMADFLERQLPAFCEKNDRLVEIAEKGLDVARDFGNDGDSVAILKTAITGVLDTLQENTRALSGALESMLALPRMSTEFNRARKRLSRLQSELKNEIARLHGLLSDAIALY